MEGNRHWPSPWLIHPFVSPAPSGAVHLDSAVGSRMGASIVCGDTPGGLPDVKDSALLQVLQGARKQMYGTRRTQKAVCMEQGMTKTLLINHENSTKQICPSYHVLRYLWRCHTYLGTACSLGQWFTLPFCGKSGKLQVVARLCPNCGRSDRQSGLASTLALPAPTAQQFPYGFEENLKGTPKVFPQIWRGSRNFIILSYFIMQWILGWICWIKLNPFLGRMKVRLMQECWSCEESNWRPYMWSVVFWWSSHFAVTIHHVFS